jgi:hypothetical protein
MTIFGWGGWDRALTEAEIHGLYDHVVATGLVQSGIADEAQVCNVGYDVVDANFPAVIRNQVNDANDFTFYVGASTSIDLVTLTGPVVAP